MCVCVCVCVCVQANAVSSDKSGDKKKKKKKKSKQPKVPPPAGAAQKEEAVVKKEEQPEIRPDQLIDLKRDPEIFVQKVDCDSDLIMPDGRVMKPPFTFIIGKGEKPDQAVLKASLDKYNEEEERLKKEQEREEMEKEMERERLLFEKGETFLLDQEHFRKSTVKDTFILMFTYMCVYINYSVHVVFFFVHWKKVVIVSKRFTDMFCKIFRILFPSHTISLQLPTKLHPLK